jgi:hypothetical protein
MDFSGSEDEKPVKSRKSRAASAKKGKSAKIVCDDLADPEFDDLPSSQPESSGGGDFLDPEGVDDFETLDLAPAPTKASTPSKKKVTTKTNADEDWDL